MSTRLGRLVLDLAADAAGFEKDMQRVSRSSKKELGKVQRDLRFAKRDLDQARAKVGRLAGAFAALGAVSLGVVVREFNKLTAEADNLGKVSRTVSLTVEELQELRFAAEQAGVESNTLDLAMQRFARRVGEAANGGGELAGIVKELGVNLRDSNGNLRSQSELLGVFADKIADAESNQEALRIAFKLFDSEGAKLVTLLREGSGALDELRDQFRQTGSAISGEAVEATERFNDAINLLSKQVRADIINAFADVIEVLADYADFLARTEAGQKLVRETLDQLATTAKVVAAAIGIGFVGALGRAVAGLFVAEARVAILTARVQTLTGASQVAAARIALFGRAVSLATGPIGIIATVLATLGFAFFSVRDKAREASEGIDQFDESLDNIIRRSSDFQAAEIEGKLLEIGSRVAELNQEIESLSDQSISEQLSGSADIPNSATQRIEQLRSELNKNKQAAAVLIAELERLQPSVTETGSAFTGATVGVSEMVEALNDFAKDAALDAIKRAGEIVESIKDMDSEIADAAARLNGPMAQALRKFQREAQKIGIAFREQDITAEQAATRLDQLQQEFEQTGAAIRDEILASLPIAIQQMIGLAQATDRAGQSFGAFNQIGNNFAQAILNGQGIRDSLSSSLLAFGGQGIGTALDQTDLTGFVKTAFTDGISAAFDSSEFKRNSAAGFALALGQAVEGNFGQAAFTAAGNALFGEIGALVGSILGDLVFGESVPKFQVRGRNATQATDAGTDRVLATDFGADLEIAFRGIEDAAKRQIVRGYSDFLSAVSGIVDDPGQREAIAGVISRFGVSSRSGPDDIEGQLELLFSDITDTFGAATQAFIRQAETLEGQVQRLADVLGFADQLADAADLLGRAFASSRTELEDFSAQLLDAFDGTADELSGVLNRVLNAAFSEEELAQQTIRNARQKATDLLTDLGIGVSEDTFSQQGLRDLIDNFLGELGPEETAQLLQAGDAIARLIDAEASLADERGTNMERLRDDWQRG